MYNRNDGTDQINALQNQFTAYLALSLHRNRMQYLRKRDKLSQMELPLEDYEHGLFSRETPLQIALKALDREPLHLALENLNDRDRYIVVSHVIEGKKFTDIAQGLGMEYKAVTTAYYRALVKMKHLLEEDIDEF